MIHWNSFLVIGMVPDLRSTVTLKNTLLFFLLLRLSTFECFDPEYEKTGPGKQHQLCSALFPIIYPRHRSAVAARNSRSPCDDATVDST